jgi:hypothetical protein
VPSYAATAQEDEEGDDDDNLEDWSDVPYL